MNNGMNTLPHKTDERVEAVHFTRDSLVVDLMDGRSIAVPLSWYPKLLNATSRSCPKTQLQSILGFF